MRNLKKFLALVLAMLMVVSAAATVSAFDDVAADHVFAEAINDLAGKKIVKGVDAENTTYNPEGAVTRKQMAIMMARAITGLVDDDTVWEQGGLVTFTDVSDYRYAIATVAQKGIISGYTDIEGNLVFKPDDAVTYVAGLKMAVCALGYDVAAVEGANWWLPYYNKALELGLTDGLTHINDANKALNRGEVAQLIHNMLYIELADGSDCFASQNFNLKTAENATTFAVTATKQQRATETIQVAEGGYVGLQEIVNDVPSGDVVYVKLADLGIASEAEAEKLFLHAVDLINYDAEEGTFGDYEFVETFDKIYNTEITPNKSSANGKYFIYNGVNYYTVEENTDTPIKNEVVLFNLVADQKYVHTEKILLLDAFGEMTDAAGNIVLKAVYSIKGEILAYQAFRDATTNALLASPVLLTEELALAQYGKEIESSNPSFKFMQANELSGAYELTVFDDDGDTYIDRAYYTPVYLSAFKAAASNKNTYGIMNGKPTSSYVDANGNATTVAAGDVIQYTYNAQLNQVTVLAKATYGEGYLTRVNTTADNTSSKVVTMVIDGVKYTLANEANDASYGWELNTLGTTTNIAEIASKGLLGYTYNNGDVTAFRYGNYVKFVAMGDKILMVQKYDLEEAYSLVVLDQLTNFDTDAIYMDLYENGEIVYDVPVSEIYLGNGLNAKKVAIADLNIFQYNDLITYVANLEKGYIFKAVVAENGLLISAPFFNNEATLAGYTALTADNIKMNALPECADAAQNTIKFDDGIGEYYKIATENILRAKSSTLWYFIKKDGSAVDVFTGTPADGSSINLANADVYANKIGYITGITDTNARDGQADTVVVYYTNDSDIKGFGVTGVGNRIIYVTEAQSSVNYNGKTTYLYDPYDYGTGADFNLPKQYAKNTYWFYNTDIAIDMETGAFINAIYADAREDIVAGHYYWLSSDNVILDEVDASLLVTETLVPSDITIGMYGKTAIKGTSYDSALFIGKAAPMKSGNAVTAPDKIAALLVAGGTTVTRLAVDSDKKFVGIVGANVTAPVDTTKVTLTVNAQWGTDGVAQADVVVAADKKTVTATITRGLENRGTTAWNTTGSYTKAPFGATDWATATVAGAGSGAATVAVNAAGQLVVTINGTLNNAGTPVETMNAIAAGTYTATVTAGDGTVVTFWFTIA